jgi:short-subunit dehydrogenase
VPTRIERALITGASAGLGAQFARRLADRGVLLTLVARREDRLEELGRSLPVDVEVLRADLGTAAGVAVVEARLARTDEPVDLLVNNAGFGAYGAFLDLPPDRQQELIDLNVTALIRLTRAPVGQLAARGVGGVINVGSTAAYQPNPFGAVYGASKAFVRSFTEAIHEELRGSGVHVMLLSPGFTDTEFQQVAGVSDGAMPTMLQTTAEQVVEAALRDFGRGRPVCVPGPVNKVNVAAVEVTPSVISRKASRVVHERFTA